MNTKVERIRSIVTYLKMLDMIDENIKVDETAIAINANEFNRLLYDIYQYNGYKNEKEMAKYLNKKYKIKLDERDIKNVWENQYFMDYMRMMYNKHSKLVNELQQVQDGNHEACNMTGGDNNRQPLDMVVYEDNAINKLLGALGDKEFVEREDVKPVLDELPLFKAYANREWDDVGKLLSNWIISLEIEKYLDIIFFPLYHLEKGETFGKYNSILIDLIGLWLNGVAIFLQFVTPIFFKLLTTLLTAASAVPIIGTGTAPIATILGIAEGPLTAFIESLPMFFKFLMSIQRKDYKRALDYLGRIFPSLGIAMISATNIVTLMNKLLLVYSDILQYVDKNIMRFKSLTDIDFNNLLSFDMGSIYNNFIKTNIKDTPLVKGIVNFTGFDKTMDKFKNKRKRIMDKYNEAHMEQMGGIMRNLIEKQNEIKNLI